MSAKAQEPLTLVDIFEVAKRQKQILWMILLSIATMFLPPFNILAGLIQVYFIYKLAKALRSSAAWLYIILCFIPLIGLLGLLHLNSRATKTLTDNGIRVGLMGAKLADLEEMTSAPADQEEPAQEEPLS